MSTAPVAKRGKATRNKVAKAVAGAEAIEVKATVPNHQIGSALRRLGMNADNDEERFIYFFDTPELDLLAANVIARARRVVGDAHDSTVKFRPVDPAKLDAKWQKFRDFKVEVDASEKGMVKSASFSMPVKRGLIKRVHAGKTPIEALFTPEQEEFLHAMGARKVDFERVVVLGPLRAQRWRLEDPACPWPVTVELWRREDGERLMEMSIKARVVQAAAAIGGFQAYLAELGAERDSDEQAKTRWALGFYAAKLRAEAKKPAAAKKNTAAKKKAATKKAPGAKKATAPKTKTAASKPVAKNAAAPRKAAGKAKTAAR
jgi:hypothetical protein